jgi:hypothetical protein
MGCGRRNRMASVRAGTLCFERGLAPEAADFSRKDGLRSLRYYRDDKTVDALMMTVSMATS